MTLADAPRRLAHLVETFDEAGLIVNDARLQEDCLAGDEYAQAQLDVAIPLDEYVGLTATPGSDPQSIYGDEVVPADEHPDESNEADEDGQESVDSTDTEQGGNGGGPDVSAAAEAVHDNLDDSDYDGLPAPVRENLTDLQAEVAEALAEHGEQAASDLQTVTGQDDGIYSRLNALEDKGFIATREDPDDARRTLYSMDIDEGGEQDRAEQEDGDEADHRIGEELDEDLNDADQEASADGGAVATDADDDIDLPGEATAEDVHDLIEALGPKPYLGEIADELGIERDRARTIVHTLDRYGDVIDAPQYKGGGD